MAEQNEKPEKERKIVLEREYIVPLRDSWLRAQKYKRGKRAVKAIKEFLVQHMKIYDRDLRKVKVDILLNNEIRFRGMQKPPAKIKVRAIKYDDGIVVAQLVNIPKHIEFEIARKARQEVEKLAKENAKPEKVEKAEIKEETSEKKEDAKEKTESSKIAEQALEKQAAKQEKHTSKTMQQTPKIQRKALKK